MVDGPSQYSGRIEIYNKHRHRNFGSYITFAQQWGTICDGMSYSQWTVEDATVVCRSLGYRFDKANIQMNQTYGLGTGLIWTTYTSCSGTEYYTWECFYSINYGYNLPSCNHSTDIGITCSGKYH